MSGIIILFFLAFPILCWIGWYHHWKKNKKLTKENQALREALDRNNIVENDQSLIDEEIQGIRLRYQLQENEIRDKLRRREEELISVKDAKSDLERVVFYFKKIAPKELCETVYKLSNDLNQYSIDCIKEQQDIEEEKRKARRQAYLKEVEENEKAEIKEKLLEKQRKRDLEKQITQELIEDGKLFPEANKRPPIPRELVDAIWNRDKGQCVYCGSNENIHIDHIIPFSKGGATCLENLQLLCEKCNLQKSDKIG